MLLKTLGENIKKYRLDSGLSQEKFALKINMDRTYFASVESGKRNIAIVNLKKIADGLNITLSELLKKYLVELALIKPYMNDGFVNERQFIAYLNNKKFSDVNSNFKEFLSFIFSNNINNDSVFIAENCSGGIKPDLSISHNGIIKHISIKKGTGNSVHQESIDVFFPFLENLTNTNCLNYLKLFHYADDSYDDSGSKRYNANQAKSRYKNQIKELNTEINKKDILAKFIDRFLFYGNVSSISADYIYHGNLDFGLWASKNEITEYILNNVFNVNGVHFGPLTYQVWGRNHDRTAVHPVRRYVMQVKWGTLTKDLANIRREDTNDF